ncbi:MAG: glycosyltransferase family 4 protein [Bacteroidales bacterium]
MRIAINEVGGIDWTGGITYRNNLIKALNTLPEKPELYIIGKADGVNLEGCSQINPYLPGSWVLKKYDSFSRHIRKKDFVMGKTLKKYNIDVLFPGRMSPGNRTASIYWIPDFQYKHLPHLYSKVQIKNLNKNLDRYFSDSAIIVVSSQDARLDLEKFFPEYSLKTRILSFVAHVPENLYNIDPKSIADIYHLPQDFIYLPNQFWVHKNHRLVLKAMKLLKDSGINPVIVCSGNPVDSRDPLHLASLMKRISEYNMRDQFIIIGLVPHDHLYSLIRQSKCVLNPSLFEGWSTTVEECKSVGKRMILSNLPVHLEQDPPASKYFKSDDAQDLAGSIKEAWLNFDSGPDLILEKEARQKLNARMRSFGETFIEICLDAIGSLKQ